MFSFALSVKMSKIQLLFKAHQPDARNAVERAAHDSRFPEAELGIEPARGGVDGVRVHAKIRAAMFLRPLISIPLLSSFTLRSPFT